MIQEDSHSLELSPLLTKLKKEIDALIGEYSVLWEEKENLVCLVQPELIIKYNLSIGTHILIYLNKNLELLQLKRKIEIIRSNLNRNVKIEITEVEEIIQKEYKDWYDKIFQLNKEIRKSASIEFFEISGSDIKKIQNIYRKLVKRLHPDINKDLSEREILLWNRVQSAYQNLDLESLLNLEILIDSNESVPKKSGIEDLENQKSMLWKKIENLNQAIQSLNEKFPLNLKDKLNDYEWVSLEVESYRKKTEEIDNVLPDYKKIYNQLLLELYGKIEEHPENL